MWCEEWKEGVNAHGKKENVSNETEEYSDTTKINTLMENKDKKTQDPFFFFFANIESTEKQSCIKISQNYAAFSTSNSIHQLIPSISIY